MYKQSLNTEDVFVMDKGMTIIQINTPNCDKDEKVRVTTKYGNNCCQDACPNMVILSRKCPNMAPITPRNYAQI